MWLGCPDPSPAPNTAEVRGCDASTGRHTVTYVFDGETEEIDLREEKWYPSLQEDNPHPNPKPDPDPNPNPNPDPNPGPNKWYPSLQEGTPEAAELFARIDAASPNPNPNPNPNP